MHAVLIMATPACGENTPLRAGPPLQPGTCAPKGWARGVASYATRDTTLGERPSRARGPRLEASRLHAGGGCGVGRRTRQASTLPPSAGAVDACGPHQLEVGSGLPDATRCGDARPVVGARGRVNARGVCRQPGESMTRLPAGVPPCLRIRARNTGSIQGRMGERPLAGFPRTKACPERATVPHLHRNRPAVDVIGQTRLRQGGRSTLHALTGLDTVKEEFQEALELGPLQILLPVSKLLARPGPIWGLPARPVGHGLSSPALPLARTGRLCATPGLSAGPLAKMRQAAPAGLRARPIPSA